MQKERDGMCVCLCMCDCGLATKENPCRIRAALSSPIKSQSHVGNALALVHHRQTGSNSFLVPFCVRLCLCLRSFCTILWMSCGPALLIEACVPSCPLLWQAAVLRLDSTHLASPQLPYRCVGLRVITQRCICVNSFCCYSCTYLWAAVQRCVWVGGQLLGLMPENMLDNCCFCQPNFGRFIAMCVGVRWRLIW